MRSYMWELNTDDAIAYEKELAELTAELRAEITEDELQLKEYIRKLDEAWATELEDEDCPF